MIELGLACKNTYIEGKIVKHRSLRRRREKRKRVT